MGALRLLNALKGQVREKEKTPLPKESKHSELMYVDIKLNGKTTKAMVDTGATHNFIATGEAERLRLTLSKDGSRMKAVNSKAQPIAGLAKEVPVSIGSWTGKANFMSVSLDDFQVILGMEFLQSARGVPMPFLDALCMMGDESPYVVPVVRKTTDARQISTLHLKKGVKMCELTYVAALKLETGSGDETLTPPVVAKLLKEFKDVMPPELPKSLPPRRARSSTTNKSPFEIITGQQPSTPHTLVIGYTGISPSAYHLAKEWHRNTEIARAYLEKAARMMKKWADKDRWPRDYSKGDLVLVKLQPASLRVFRNVHKGLVRKYEGSFPIVGKVGKVSYCVQLPAWLKIHPVFHTSCLKPYHADREDPSRNSSTRPTPTISSVERRVDKILADRLRKLPSGAAEREFLVQWKNLPKAEASWEHEDALRHEEDKIREYQQKTSTDTSG
uniref:Chromo domain-containing protein n=1 Tax=Ananas comosus var. bracteatus TaxID=296719 RepID=A0A6V7P5L2_ANACO|nr:unnamed protein product [Ananas comosus var. bracteatus]